MKTIKCGLKLLFLASTLITISACTMRPAKMAIPKDFAAKAEPMPTKDRSFIFSSRPFSFGEFNVREIDSSSDFFDRFGFYLTPSTKITLIDKDTHFQFQLDTNKTAIWHTKCSFNKKGQAFQISSGDVGTRVRRQKMNLYCEFKSGQNSDVWEMTIANSYETNDRLNGDATILDNTFLIKSNNRNEGSGEFEGVLKGFDLYLDENQVGAVSILNDGVVWIDKSMTLEKRQQLAAVSSALLMYGRLESFHK